MKLFIPGPWNSLSWVEYWQLKLDEATISPYTELWFKYMMSCGASQSPHSDILAAEGTPVIPHRSFNDHLLDLRVFGQRRQEAHGTLIRAWVDFALSNTSPLLQLSKQSLIVSTTLSGSVRKPFVTGSQARSLLRLALENLEAMWEEVDDPEYRKQLSQTFEGHFTTDIEYCLDFGGSVIVEDHKLEKFMKYCGYPVQFLTDPYFFTPESLPTDKDTYREVIWAHQTSLFRHLFSIRETLKSLRDEEEAEQLCSTACKLVLDFSIFYNKHFLPIELPDYAQEDCPFYTGPFGDVPRWLSRMMFQNQSRLTFCLFNLIRATTHAYSSNMRLVELNRSVEYECHHLIAAGLKWVHNAFRYHKIRNPQVLHDSEMVGDLIVILNFRDLPGGYAYFALWCQRNVSLVDEGDLMQILSLWKHMSWQSKTLGDGVSQFEQELSFSGRATDSDKQHHGVPQDLVGFEHTYSDLVYSGAVVLGEFPSKEDEYDDFSSLQDFDRTLGKVLS
ncbi:hypothetical protein BT69DRAFT_1346331 [Atractiella rhizophila]|nr:hypothetical protein BT69DRAFT_1346331 [Atractiella rhizophila]